MNVDSVLLNMGIGNSTAISRDAGGRPVTVKKTIGSVPPAIETTTYSYSNGDNMEKTIYKKCSIDATKLTVVPSETITIEYCGGVPWSGMQKIRIRVEQNNQRHRHL